MTANGKYTSQSGSVDVGGGYRHFISDYTSITPSASIQYTYTKDGGYTETGAGNQSLTIKKKHFSTVTANVGGSVSSYYDLGKYHVAPELYGNIHQYLGGKVATVGSSMSGQPDPFVSKSKKTNYNLGLGLAAKIGSTEFGVGYDAQLAKKYVGHQGSLKVRINF
jgi:outer membrane autotransporter protein